MKLITPLSFVCALAACQSPSTPARAPQAATAARAALGVTTSVPSEEQARAMGLEFEVRQQGRVVTSIAGDSAAEQANLRVGDVLLQLGEVVLYSQDDIDDLLSIHEPGDEISATLVRSGTREREQKSLTLGAGETRGGHAIDWQYASLAQLPAALERARAEKKKVLVGLSGAET